MAMILQSRMFVSSRTGHIYLGNFIHLLGARSQDPKSFSCSKRLGVEGEENKQKIFLMLVFFFLFFFFGKNISCIMLKCLWIKLGLSKGRAWGCSSPTLNICGLGWGEGEQGPCTTYALTPLQGNCYAHGLKSKTSIVNFFLHCHWPSRISLMLARSLSLSIFIELWTTNAMQQVTLQQMEIHFSMVVG